MELTKHCIVTYETNPEEIERSTAHELGSLA